jgi:uncharacterized membrane protein (UPF0182 family)
MCRSAACWYDVFTTISKLTWLGRYAAVVALLACRELLLKEVVLQLVVLVHVLLVVETATPTAVLQWSLQPNKCRAQHEHVGCMKCSQGSCLGCAEG